MSNFSIYVFALVVGLLNVLTGCVPPGPKDLSLLGRYQHALAQRGSQERSAEEGLGALTPEPVSGLPAFEVVCDEQTGKKVIHLSLDEAVIHAMVNNLDIRVVSFDSAISHEEVIKAAAEFDHTIFAAAGYAKEDKRTASTFTAGQSKTYSFDAGVGQKFVTGAEWSLGWTFGRVWDNSGFNNPNPNYEPTLVFKINQPLLRDAWAKVNLANLRKARLNQEFAMARFRQKLEEVVTDVISIYWSLIQARGELQIAEELLAKTEGTLRRVRGRQERDATSVQIEQANEKFESRRAGLIQARKNVKDTQNRLAQLLADHQINVLDEIEIVPSSIPNTQEKIIDTEQWLETALKHNPVLHQARLAIEIADIDLDVAEHQRLPKLNLTASTTLQGLDDSPGDAHEGLASGEHFGWSAGLSVEFPLGNRLREAQLQKSKFERLKAITTCQNFRDQVALLVKEHVRQVDNSYQQWLVQQAAVKASRKQLQALEDTEQIRGQLTPEFLLVKLQAQENLADAESAQQRAIINYNIALVELAEAGGTVLELYPVKNALPFVAGEANQPKAEIKTIPEQPETTTPNEQ